MPVKSVRVSSVSGEIIPDGTGSRVRIIWADDSRVDLRADLTDDETFALIETYKAEQVSTRPDRRHDPHRPRR